MSARNCDYCDRSVAEENYLDHLREEHYDELGRIDRRRVDLDTEGGGTPLGDVPLGSVALATGILVLGAVGVYFLVSGGGSGGLPEHGNQTLLQDVEQFPSQGTEHVPGGTQVDYDTTPPTSGPHYGSTVSAGFYDHTPALGSLVHSLEHGAVVIYYDPGAITPEARSHLQSLASTHTGTWSSVIVVAHPEDDPDAPYVLTAWRHRLRMDSYDEDVVRAFLAEYLGRGPEHPVR